jgi:glyoxylase I family protein
MSTVTGFHHIALTVSDADVSAEFYGELLGLQEAFQIDDDIVYARVFAGDGFLFGVRHYKNHDKDRFSEFRTGLDHLAFGVPDRAALSSFERKLEQLAATYTSTCETPLGPVLVFRDPDGIQVEFFLAAAS